MPKLEQTPIAPPKISFGGGRYLSAAAHEAAAAPRPPCAPASGTGISDLSSDLLTKIFFHGSLADVRAARAVSRDFRQAASHPKLLRQKLDQAGVRAPVGSDDATWSWTAGLKKLHSQKNLARGLCVREEIPSKETGPMYPPELTLARRAEIDQIASALSIGSQDQTTSHDGSLFVYTSLDSVHLVDMTHPTKEERVLDWEYFPTTNPVLSRDAHYLAVGFFRGNAMVWDLRDDTQTWIRCGKRNKHVESLALSSDGGKLAVLLSTSLWQVEINHASSLAEALSVTASAVKRTLRRKNADLRVFDLTTSPPSQLLATGLNLKMFYSVTELAFSPDDSRLLCNVMMEDVIRVWNFEAPGKPVDSA